MKTIQITFSMQFHEGLDRLYTYKTADAVQPGQIGYVLAGSQVKKVRVVTIDAEYNHAAEKRFGALASVFAEPPVAKPKHRVTKL